MTFETTGRQPDRAAGNGTGYAARAATPVIALHCSGADGGQWRKLAAAVGDDRAVYAPSLIGSGDTAPWRGQREFTLADEARLVIDVLDGLSGPAHLVGHSYGGAVALKVASLRRDRIASLSLYEPSAFHLLHQTGAGDVLAEIEGIAGAVVFGLVTGAYQEAAATFVDYWNGPGAWAALRPGPRDALVRWLPKGPLEFRAALGDHTPLASFRQITCPVQLLRGEHARAPSRRIIEDLARELPNAVLDVLPGAGHMAPLTHARQVNDRVVAHIHAAEAAHLATAALGSMAA